MARFISRHSHIRFSRRYSTFKYCKQSISHKGYYIDFWNRKYKMYIKNKILIVEQISESYANRKFEYKKSYGEKIDKWTKGNLFMEAKADYDKQDEIRLKIKNILYA